MVKWTKEYRAQQNRDRIRANLDFGLCGCGRPNRHGNRGKCERCAALDKISNQRTRLLVLEHYGIFGIPECHCCGERRIEFLAIDHVAGNGNQHREALRIQLGWKSPPKGNMFYRILIRLGFPEGFRDLCSNCNQSMGAYGYCPHQLEQRARGSNK